MESIYEGSSKLIGRGPKPQYCYSLNVSRAFGDRSHTLEKDISFISQKPKVTVQQLLPGDRLILCCDGLMDYTSKEGIQNLVNQPLSPSELSQALVDLSLAGQGWSGGDNVTVMVVDIAAS